MALNEARKPKFQPACLGPLRSLRMCPVQGWERGRETAEERRCAQRNSEVKSSLRSLRSLRLRKNRARATGSEPHLAEPSSIFTAEERKGLKDSGSSRERAVPRVGESARPKSAPLPRSQRETSKRSLNSVPCGTCLLCEISPLMFISSDFPLRKS
jgi:hypothetical protein